MGSKTSIIVLFCVVVALSSIGLTLGITDAGNKTPGPPTSAAPPPITKFAVSIRQPDAPRVITSATNYSGEPVTVSCASCHTTTTPNTALRDAGELKQFHQGMIFNHGELTCVSCHNVADYDTLRLADNTALQFPNVIQLCGQCHGPQARDFRNGAHGGMTGYWDLNRGSRQRNTCTDCHDPHSPAYPVVMPVFQPPPAQRGQALGPGALENSAKH